MIPVKIRPVRLLMNPSHISFAVIKLIHTAYFAAIKAIFTANHQGLVLALEGSLAVEGDKPL